MNNPTDIKLLYGRLWLLSVCAYNTRWQHTMCLTKRCTYTGVRLRPLLTTWPIHSPVAIASPVAISATSIPFHVRADISYINTCTVCVCPSVCPSRDLRNRMSYRRASFVGVNRFSWWIAQTAFWAYTMRGLRGKVFWTFGRLCVGGGARMFQFPITLGMMNLAHRLNAVGTFSKVMGNIVDIAFYVNGKLITQ